MAESFEVATGEGRGRAALLRVKGSLDAKGAQQLLMSAASVLSNGENLVLNLSAVTFVGSSGIGSLLILVEQFREQGCTIRFVEVSPAVSSIVDLLNLSEFLPIASTENEALDGLAA